MSVAHQSKKANKIKKENKGDGVFRIILKNNNELIEILSEVYDLYNKTESRFPQIWHKLLSVESALKHLAEAHRGLIEAQKINTEKLNTIMALAEQDQKFKHLDQIDATMGLALLEDDVGEEWVAPWA
jgi:alanyl-tRNA synthetase